MNEVLKTIATRYSCRGFTEQCPTSEQLNAIAKAAIASPSGMNLQKWRIIVINDKALLDEMDAEGIINLSEMSPAGSEKIRSRGGKLFYNAPSMIMIAADKNKDEDMTAMDCGIVSQTVALAAASLGLGNVICKMCEFAFMGGDKAEEFKKRLKFPEGYEFALSVLIGYAKAPVAPHEPDEGKIIIIE